MSNSSFSLVTYEDIDAISHFLKKTKYHESNHNIINMFLWQDMFPLFKFESKHYMLLMSKHKEVHFLFMPLCEEKYIEDGLLKGQELFHKMGLDFVLSATTSKVRDIACNLFEGLNVSTARDGYDYIYDRDSVVTLSGKKLQKRRNLLNKFKNQYEDIAHLAPIHSVVREVVDFFNGQVDEDDDEYLIHERNGIFNLLGHIDFFDYQGAALLINNQVKGFIITSLVDETMVQINVEKADKNIPGIFQYLESEYFKMFYPDIQYINKEDDMGRVNLRKAKLASKPIKLIKKYRLCQGVCNDNQSKCQIQD